MQAEPIPTTNDINNAAFQEEEEFTYRSYVENTKKLAGSVRINFVRKVFGIVAAQLIFTALFAYVSLRLFKFKGEANAIGMLAAAIVVIGGSLTLFFSDRVARKVPVNYLVLAAITLGESYLLAFLVKGFATSNVLLGLTLTGAVVGILSLYAMRIDTDITYLGSFFTLTSTGFVCFSIVTLFFKTNILYSLFCLFLCIGSGIHFVYIMKAMLGNQGASISHDDYIRGALMLYVTIIDIFVKILRVLDPSKAKKRIENLIFELIIFKGIELLIKLYAKIKDRRQPRQQGEQREHAE